MASPIGKKIASEIGNKVKKGLEQGNVKQKIEQTADDFTSSTPKAKVGFIQGLVNKHDFIRKIVAFLQKYFKMFKNIHVSTSIAKSETKTLRNHDEVNQLMKNLPENYKEDLNMIKDVYARQITRKFGTAPNATTQKIIDDLIDQSSKKALRIHLRGEDTLDNAFAKIQNGFLTSAAKKIYENDKKGLHNLFNSTNNSTQVKKMAVLVPEPEVTKNINQTLERLSKKQPALTVKESSALPGSTKTEMLDPNSPLAKKLNTPDIADLKNRAIDAETLK